MKRIAAFLVDRRKAVFITMMLLMLVSAVLIPRVKVNTDMTKYLPDSSAMKQGVDIMAKEFPDMAVPNTVRVMFRDLPDGEEEKILTALKKTPHVDSVSFAPGDERYEKDGYTLYILNFSVGFFSSEMGEAEQYIRSEYDGYCDMVYCLDKTNQQGVPVWIFVLALVLLVTILAIFCHSWLEPVLFLFCLGVAVVINMGSNILLPYVSEITWSIGAILQLALSIDYSVILMSRYRQELRSAPDKESAMKAALEKAFSSVAGSAFTTVVGFLVLVFMSFKIGLDMGIVMAKGVFLSMFCILTILPFLVLTLDSLIQKTQKKVLTLKMNAVSRFSYRHRKIIAALFVVFFVVVFFLKGKTGITFTLIAKNEIDPIFPKENQIVLLYENADEEAVAKMIPQIEEEKGVNSVMAWPNTLGKAFTADELCEMIDSPGMDTGFDLSPEMVKTIYAMYFGSSGQQESAAGSGEGQKKEAGSGKEQEHETESGEEQEKESGSVEKEQRLTIQELLQFVTEAVSGNLILQALISDEMKDSLSDAPAMLEKAGKQLKGPEHSLMAISTSLPQESEETSAFMKRLKELSTDSLSGNWYLIGNTPMAVEMVKTFSGELNFLTLLTAGAIFLVVLITFRSFAVPVILVLLIQSAVFTTMVIMNLQGMSIYYLALLIVQSILMGSTIDYAILFTNYYREMRLTRDPESVLQEAYNLSVHTILTSGCIVISVTAIVGYAFTDPSVQQIVHTISKGAACALVLILFVLPGLLGALDRLVVIRKKQ